MCVRKQYLLNPTSVIKTQIQIYEILFACKEERKQEIVGWGSFEFEDFGLEPFFSIMREDCLVA
jgi:hypothetical protein